MFFSEDNIISINKLPEHPDFQSGCMLLIDKPLEWTSFDVVNKLRFKLRYSLGVKKIKVGHAGTLDPLATGLLLVCCGKATRHIDTLTNMDKCYSGSFFIGATTATFDRESTPENQCDTSAITESQILEAGKEFIGEQMQVPPLFSAIRVNGKKGYELARRGVEKQLEARKIIIHDFKITYIRLPEIGFEVICSKGTYIRSVAHDFGKILNVGAYLNSLRRESIGPYNVSDALTIETATQYIEGCRKDF